MWQLLKSEFSYNKIMITGMLCFTLFSSFFSITQTDGDANIVIVFFAYIIVHTMIARINKEKRLCRHVFLPLPIRKSGLTRVLIILIPFFTVFILFYILQFVLGQAGHKGNIIVFAFFGFYILGFSVYLVGRDLFSHLRKRESFIAVKIAILISAFLALLGMVVFTATLSNSEEIPWFMKLIGGFFDFALSTTGILVVYSLNLCLYYLSVVTYVRRKSYLR